MLDPQAGFALGQSWEISYQIIRDSGRTSDKKRSCSVAAHEPALVVRAGIFDAYRVDCLIETLGDAARYGQSWYDARTWRALEHNVGADETDLQKVLELVEITLQPR